MIFEKESILKIILRLFLNYFRYFFLTGVVILLFGTFLFLILNINPDIFGPFIIFSLQQIDGISTLMLYFFVLSLGVSLISTFVQWVFLHFFQIKLEIRSWLRFRLVFWVISLLFLFALLAAEFGFWGASWEILIVLGILYFITLFLWVCYFVFDFASQRISET